MNIIKEIFEIEKKAAAISGEARECLSRLEKEVCSEAENKRALILERAKKKIVEIEEKEREMTVEAVLLAEREAETAAEKMDAAYGVNRQKWEDMLFERITGKTHV